MPNSRDYVQPMGMHAVQPLLQNSVGSFGDEDGPDPQYAKVEAYPTPSYQMAGYGNPQGNNFAGGQGGYNAGPVMPEMYQPPAMNNVTGMPVGN